MGGVYDPSTGLITWDVGFVAGEGMQVVTLSVAAKVKVPVATGIEDVTNTISVIDETSVSPDPTPANNTATDIDRIVAAPDLYVLKTDNLDQARVGQTITYVITGGNAGNQTAGGVVVSDLVPPSLRVVSVSGGGSVSGNQVTWNLGDLTPGATFSLTITALVESVPPGGTVLNPVTITDQFGSFEDPTPSNNSAFDLTKIVGGFGFDAFNNFSLPGDFMGDDDRPFGFSPGPVDIYRGAMLPVVPIYSGEADPGSTLAVDLYNPNGELIGTQTVVVDAGGNWLVTFPSSVIRDMPSTVRITQINALHVGGDTGSIGFNLRNYFAPALNPGQFFFTGENATRWIGGEEAPLLSGLVLENPISADGVKYSGDFLSVQGTPGGR
jgi:uncharacterized repeat protein (TIGR01451 family)